MLLKGRRSGLLTGRLGSQRLRASETPFKNMCSYAKSASVSQDKVMKNNRQMSH